VERRLFLKSAITTCGVVVIGLPNLATSASAGSTSAKHHHKSEMHFQGDPRTGCATPWHRHNQHDSFPQDPHKLSH
jgi:hypothetical protein